MCSSSCFCNTARTDALEEPERPNAARLALSADGAYVPLLKGVWAEVRTVVIGEVKTEKKADGTTEVHVQQISSFSRMTDATTFADLAEGGMQRRGVRQAEEVCAVTDGADWLQSFLDLHRPEVQRILDFPHAAEHVSALIQGVRQASIDLPTDLLERILHQLKQRGPRLLMRLLDRLPTHVANKDGVREQIGYLRKREALMQYPDYQQNGWPIGSGMVESANKLVVQARLKGAGMRFRSQPCQSHALSAQRRL